MRNNGVLHADPFHHKNEEYNVGGFEWSIFSIYLFFVCFAFAFCFVVPVYDLVHDLKTTFHFH